VRAASLSKITTPGVDFPKTKSMRAKINGIGLQARRGSLEKEECVLMEAISVTKLGSLAHIR